MFKLVTPWERLWSMLVRSRCVEKMQIRVPAPTRSSGVGVPASIPL